MRTIIILAIICCISGCAETPVKPVVPIVSASELDYQTAAMLMKENKFNEAIILYRKIITEAPGTQLESTSQYQIAIAYAFSDNPEKSYALAIQNFEEFIRLHPDDGKVLEARNWISILKLYSELKKQNESLKKENEQFRKSIEELKRLDIMHEERRQK